MSSKDESATIDIDRLSFAYNGNRVLHDVSLRLAPGEMVAVIGPNGAGKTTSIAKMAHSFTKGGKRVILGAADTFRAAAIEQLQILGQQVGVDVDSFFLCHQSPFWRVKQA